MLWGSLFLFTPAMEESNLIHLGYSLASGRLMFEKYWSPKVPLGAHFSYR